MGDRPCDRDSCPNCNMQVTIGDEQCPGCGVELSRDGPEAR